MTLPSSPPISMDQVLAEFGAPAGTPLHAFVRGGAYVPNITSNSSVPTAPPITLHQLCGASAYQSPVISGPTLVNFYGAQANPTRNYTVLSGQSVTGGNGITSISWVRISGSAGIGCLTPTTVNCTFQANGGLPRGTDTEYTAVWRLTVKDHTSTVTKDLTVHFIAPSTA